jgi:CHAD domain-containing protein
MSSIGEELAEQIRQELSWIAKLLGRVRDIDIIQERFNEQFRRVRASARTMEWFARYYGEKRKKYLTRLQRALVSSRYENILQMLTDIDELIKLQGEDAQRSIGDLAPKLIETELQDIRKWMKKPAEVLSPSDLHQLRIEFKGLRYTAEFFSDLYGKEMKKMIGQLVLFQDCLGLYQDAQVAEETLNKFIKKMGQTPDDPVELILSTGSLIQVQRDIQDQQRRRFIEMWIKFHKTLKNFQTILNLVSHH